MSHSYTRQEQQTDINSGYFWYERNIIIPKSVSDEILRLENEDSPGTACETIESGYDSTPGDNQTLDLELECDQDKRLQEAFPFPYLFASLSPQLKILSKHQVWARYEQLATITADRDEAKKIKAQLDLIRERGEFRNLVTVPPTWRSDLDTLGENHPNFAKVVQYLRTVCARALAGDSVMRPGNILLDGPPGCGKTYFAKKLAGVFGMDFHEIHLEATQTAGEIIGDSDSYHDAKPGKLFDIITTGSTTSPLILMDEICKQSGDSRFNPASALYRIFEKETAKTFTDTKEHWLSLDVSHIFLVCTSNAYENIEPALRSRLKRFSIEMPADPTAIIHSIFVQLMNSNSTGGEMALSSSAVESLMTQAPRRIRQLLEDAIGSALYHERNVVLPEDLDIELARAPMGF